MYYRRAFILFLVSLQIQMIVQRRRDYSKKLHHRKYKDPYSVCSCNKHAYASGSRGPSIGPFEAKRIHMGDMYSKYHHQKPKKKITTEEPITEELTTIESTTIQQKNGYSDELDQIYKKETTLKVASLFRNNLIKVFGYVLHRPNMELNSELYTSLYFILSNIKLNQVNILSIVPILKEITFKTPNERFLKIFEAMEKHLPVYLRCAAGFWKDAIKTKEVNMDSILKPTADGSLKVDVLEGMSDELLQKIIESEKSTVNLKQGEKKVLYNFNMDIVQIMEYIKEHGNQIQQFFFSGLLVYFPKNLIQPDLEESIQIVTEFLDQNEVEEWENYVSLLDDSNVTDPFDIVRIILKKLILNNNVPIVIKEAIQIILNNLTNRNPTAINPHYNSFSTLINLEDIKISYMLQYINEGHYPRVVVAAAVRLIYYLEHDYIKHITLMSNFYPYLYSSPTEVLIAILDRIIKRQPDLPPEIKDSAGTLYSHLTFILRYTVFPTFIPDDMLNLNVIFLALQAPDLDQDFLGQLNIMISLIISKHLSFPDMLLSIPVYKCATPIVCFSSLLKFMLTVFPDPPTENLILDLLKRPCYTVSCVQDPRRMINETSLFPIELNPLFPNDFLPNITTTSTTLITMEQPSEGPISSPTTLKSTEATPPTTPSSNNSVIEKAEAVVGGNTTAIISVAHEIASNDQDEVYVKQILKILNSDKYKVKFKEMKGTTHVVLISSILVYWEMIQDTLEGEFESQVHAYLDKFFNTLKHIEDIMKLITTEKLPTRPVLARLIVAVPAPMDNETEIFKRLSMLLQKEELFTLIVKNLEKESYKNVGSLLKAVLHEEIKLKEKLTVQELEAAKYYVNKVQLLGFGQGKISWGVDIDTLSQNIDIAQILDNAIGYESLNNEDRKKFNSIIVYIRQHLLELLQTWDKWIYYTKCGDFTKALYTLILNEGGLPINIRENVLYLRSFINYDGKGAEPIFKQ